MLLEIQGTKHVNLSLNVFFPFCEFKLFNLIFTFNVYNQVWHVGVHLEISYQVFNSLNREGGPCGHEPRNILFEPR